MLRQTGVLKQQKAILLFSDFGFCSAFSCQTKLYASCGTFSSTIPYIKSQLSSALECGNSSKPPTKYCLYYTIDG